MPKKMLFLIFIFVIGCASVQYTSTSKTTYPPKSANCDFDVLTENPSKHYEVIGVVDIKPGNTGTGWVQDLGTFKEKVQSEVCSNGGDAVIVKMSGMGVYQNGSVIKYKK